MINDRVLMFTSTLLSLTTDLVFIDLIKFIHLSKLNSFY